MATESEKAKLEEEYATLEAKYTQSEQKQESLQNENIALKGQAHEKEHDMKGVQNENISLKGQLQAKDSKYDELQSQHLLLVAKMTEKDLEYKKIQEESNALVKQVAEKDLLLAQVPSSLNNAGNTPHSEKKMEEYIPILVNASINMLCTDMPVTGYTTATFKNYVDKSIKEVSKNKPIDKTADNKKIEKTPHIAKKWIDLAWIGIPEKYRNQSGASSSKKTDAPIQH